jgi:ankyrin repeat protein
VTRDEFICWKSNQLNSGIYLAIGAIHMFRTPVKKRERNETVISSDLASTGEDRHSPQQQPKFENAEQTRPNSIECAEPEFGLPPEVFVEICREFGPHEPVRQVSRAFYQFFHDNQVWLTRLKKHFPEYAKTLEPHIGHDYKAHYKIAHQQHYSGIPKAIVESLYFAREGNAEKLFECDHLEYTRSVYDLARLRDHKYTIFQILIRHGHQSILNMIYAKSQTEARPGWTSVLESAVFTKIHWAIACRQPLAEIQKTLQLCPLQVNMHNHDGSTPLGLAMELDDMPAFKAVLASPHIHLSASASKDQNALTFAARKGNVDMVKAILALRTNPNTKSKNGASPLSTAVSHGHTAVVQALLNPHNPFQINIDKLSPDISQQEYYTPLHLAAIHGHLEIVILLLQSDADINYEVLHSHEDDFRETGTTALHLALSHHHWPVALHLLSNAAIDVNFMNMHGFTPLHTAMAECHQHLVMALLERGADLLINDRNINSVMCFAAIFGCIDIAERCVAFDETIKSQHLAIPERMILPIKTIIKKEANHTPWTDVPLQPHEIAHLMGHDALEDLLKPNTPRLTI